MRSIANFYPKKRNKFLNNNKDEFNNNTRKHVLAIQPQFARECNNYNLVGSDYHYYYQLIFNVVVVFLSCHVPEGVKRNLRKYLNPSEQKL